MKLRDLLTHLPPERQPAPGATAQALEAALAREVKGLCTNSHACQPGDLFIGMPGTRVDGGEFWPGAIEAGAIAALVSAQALQRRPVDASQPVFAIDGITTACGELAAAFYDHPSQGLDLVGVTGTNGKTTTTHLIEFLLQAAQQPTALLGTLYSRWPGFQQVAQHTTPFAVELQADLAAARAAGATAAIMEVSSHALAQQRVWGCQFKVAVFTNLTQDHLDYHRDLEDYFAAKALLFSPDYLQGRAIINGADAYGRRLIEQLGSDRSWRYDISDPTADLYTSDLSYRATGVSGQLHTPVGNGRFASPLVGQFNLENLLAAVGAALSLGCDLAPILAALPRFPGVPGRMQQVQISAEQDISVIVDYAHTPDSLKNALKAARPFVPGRLICVFGCGGDRDRTKRPQMGQIAYDLADVVIVTSDNPRTEDPQQILADIVAGIPASLPAEAVKVDRAAAIHQAIMTAQPGDGVLIAGKGHEDYQILGTEKVHFDDREQAKDALDHRYSQS
ncbi:UDP-N-acetylmuramoyl-L-alanyl-D-glutamate--2,6-diaminopimelate ligase [filamentous cyanobacterium CCP5]|nr:UDP-N-acetylmuramoyl-L-alanyl-D-glutamate--2,6-diaminopimelate ligase [filamentous cyanobacterium CCP5]